MSSQCAIPAAGCTGTGLLRHSWKGAAGDVLLVTQLKRWLSMASQGPKNYALAIKPNLLGHYCFVNQKAMLLLVFSEQFRYVTMNMHRSKELNPTCGDSS
jgi:hypothetical protein